MIQQSLNQRMNQDLGHQGHRWECVGTSHYHKVRVGRPLLIGYASPRFARATPALASSPELGRRGPPNPVDGKEGLVAFGGSKSRAVKCPPGMPIRKTFRIWKIGGKSIANLRTLPQAVV